MSRTHPGRPRPTRRRSPIPAAPHPRSPAPRCNKCNPLQQLKIRQNGSRRLTPSRATPYPDHPIPTAARLLQATAQPTPENARNCPTHARPEKTNPPRQSRHAPSPFASVFATFAPSRFPTFQIVPKPSRMFPPHAPGKNEPTDTARFRTPHKTKNPAEAGISSSPATSRGLPQLVADQILEAGGIEPPSRDNSNDGLYMLSGCFNLKARGDHQQPPPASSRLCFATRPTAESGGYPAVLRPT